MSIEFLLRESPNYFTEITLLLCIIGLSAIKYSNPQFALGLIPDLSALKKNQPTVVNNGNTKSSAFMLVGYFLLFSIVLFEFSKLNWFMAIIISSVFISGQIAMWFLFNQLAINASDVSIFYQKKLKLLQSVSLIMLCTLMLYHFFGLSSILTLLIILLSLLVVIIQTCIILSDKLSLFHLILYICNLEILPVILLIKWLSKLN